METKTRPLSDWQQRKARDYDHTYRTYKNRKKTLRRAEQAGRITRHERIEKQKEAFAMRCKGERSEAREAYLELSLIHI